MSLSVAPGAAVLPRSTPSQQGVDPGALVRLLDALETAGIELHSLMVLRHGHVVAEGWWAPYRPSGLHLLYSLSKSFTSTAIGLAVEEGLLDIDDPVLRHFGELAPAEPSPRLQRMRVRHLLSMTTGHREDTVARLDRLNPVGSFLAVPPEEEPGTWFTYNQGATLTLSALITRLTGQRLLDYLRPRLLDPLGITEANWQGLRELDLGFSGLHAPTEAVAKLGQLYLQRGRWQGRQLVAETWVAEATSRQIENPREPNPDWRQGYGYQFWQGRHGYRGDGACGQFCLVLPEADVVVATTAATEDMQLVLDAIHGHLLPGFGGTAGDGEVTGVEDALAARLAQLRLPVAEGERATPSSVSLPWSAPAPATGVRLTHLESDAQGWRVTFADDQSEYALRCGYGTWLESETAPRPGTRLRIAACGAWRPGATFVLQIRFIETPHGLTLTCDCTSGRTKARWNVAPLGDVPIGELALDLDRF
ncbi:MAG TPA: serine hydrolase domain-containing protein [Propionibacteriaceae bacterium]|nr:serine hydrolase domain-containing protein [Propionibacteriaceae bacterium]